MQRENRSRHNHSILWLWMLLPTMALPRPLPWSGCSSMYCATRTFSPPLLIFSFEGSPNSATPVWNARNIVSAQLLLDACRNMIILLYPMLYASMYHNMLANQLVISINVPQVIWRWNWLVFTMENMSRYFTPMGSTLQSDSLILLRLTKMPSVDHALTFVYIWEKRRWWMIPFHLGLHLKQQSNIATTRNAILIHMSLTGPGTASKEAAMPKSTLSWGK